MVEAVIEDEPLGVECDLEIAVFQLRDEHRGELTAAIAQVDVLEPDRPYGYRIGSGADHLWIRRGLVRVTRVDQPQLAVLGFVHSGQEAKLRIVGRSEERRVGREGGWET